MKTLKVMMLGILTTIIALCSFSLGNKAYAAEDSNVKVTSDTEKVNGRVFYDTNNLYTMHGTKNGVTWSDTTASLAVQYPDGHNEMVFCVAPGVPLVGGMWTDGYEGIESSAIDREAMIAASIWQDVFPNKTQHEEIASRAVVWNYLSAYNLNITSIDGIPEYPQLKQKLVSAVDNYKKVPSFDKKTIKLTYGKTTNISSGGVNLNSFDSVLTNSGNVKFDIASDGMNVNVTPTDPSKATGKYQAIKNTMWGTPIIWTHPDSQTVVTPKISDPASFTVNFDIDTYGEFQIRKVDKETGEAVPNTVFKLEYSNVPAGVDAPKEQSVTTGKDGLSPKIKLIHGAHVKATEINVPNPYVLGSAVGDSDVVEGNASAGETITLTAKNMKAKGQIVLEKSGVESGKTPWNDKYTLENNQFDVHKDTADGEIVTTMKTDAKGHAETAKNLPLGKYFVTESQASQGFANTFKPVEVNIEYANQTQAVIVKGTEGTNQEVVGSTLLTKEDAETKNETQGKATFDGAEYGLFHADGTAVKWSENFKPVTSKGTKMDGDEIKFAISDKEQQASVEHLALGDYYWQELVAPEGYQIDNTKREFSITYKDQDTKVIETKATSKENVVKFNLDGFKYVDSKSGNVKSGYNGIEFKLSPLDPTKGKERKVTTKTDENGYDGYWAFNEVPYGDYKMSEVKAPEGYQTIKDLTINSSFNKDKREYTFTITEDGQKEALKTLTVPEKQINEGSNVIRLSKLFLTNKVKEIPEKPSIETLFVTKDGGKTFDPTKDQELIDEVSATVPKEDIGKTFYYVTQFHKIDKDGKETVVGTTESSHKANDLTYSFKAIYNYKANTLKDGEKLVATHFAYEDKDHKKEYAKHYDLKNEKQTLTAKTPTTPASTPTTPATPTKTNSVLPQTSGTLGNPIVLLIAALVIVAGAIFIFVVKKRDAQK